MQVSKARKGYKLVDVGFGKFEEIPEEWEYKTIGDMIKFEGGSQPSKTDFIYAPKPGYVRIIQMRDFKTDEYKTYIPEKSTKKFFKKDDVMIGRYGPPNFQIYRGLEGAYNVALIKAIPKNGLEKDYLYHFLKQEKLFQIMDSLGGRTAGQDGVDLIHLKKLLFPLPSINERKKIVIILSNVDNTLEKTNQLIKKTKSLKEGMMQKLLTKGIGYKKFKKVKCYFGREIDIPENWNVKSISEITDVIMGQSPSGDTYNKFEGTPLLNGPTEFGAINPIAIQFTKKPTKICKINDILLCVRGSTTGRLNIADQEYCIGRGLAAIRGRKEVSSTSWLFENFLYLKKMIYNYSSGGGSTFPNISQEFINEIKLPFPQISEQKQIADILSNIDSQIAKEKLNKSNLEILKKGLMQKLLTGQIRVKV